MLPALFGFLIFSPRPSTGDETSDPALAERELAELREQLQQVERDLQHRTKLRDQAQQELRNAERKASGARRRLAGIDSELTATRERLDVLEHRAEQARAEIATHIAGLAQELRRAYILGRDDWLRTVLGRQDPVEIGRYLVYSSYLARERSERASALRADLDALDATLAELDEENQRLVAIRQREQERLDEVAALRRDRSTALTRINRGIATSSEKLDRMRDEMAELQSLVDELSRVLNALPGGDSQPFAEARGRLEKPANGRIVQRFGQPRADGRLHWHGMLLAADAGAEVRAVHYGRVIYADWLQGMGLLVIIDHGDGYLSLYGHNQDVVAQVGDWVTPGSVIAHVGDSGGRAVPGLYFEIRKDGKPIDPGGWLHK